jgi:hypothetical protein
MLDNRFNLWSLVRRSSCPKHQLSEGPVVRRFCCTSSPRTALEISCFRAPWFQPRVPHSAQTRGRDQDRHVRDQDRQKTVSRPTSLNFIRGRYFVMQLLLLLWFRTQGTQKYELLCSTNKINNVINLVEC